MIDLETRLRRAARLLDEMSAGDAEPENVDVVGSQRAPGPRWWLTAAGIAAAAAAVVGLVVVTGSGDEAAAPGTEPASSGTQAPPASSSGSTGDTSTGGTKATPDSLPTMDQLRSYQWVAVEVGGEPWPLPSLPTVEFGAPGSDSFVTGNDGCNSFGGTGRLDGGRLVVGDVISTMMECAETAEVVLPQDGDRIVLTESGTRLALFHSGGDSARIVYVRLDALDSVGELGALSGAWRLGAGDVAHLDFGSDTLTLGACKGVSYEFSSSRLRLLDIPTDAPSACAPGSDDWTFGWLADLLVAGPVEVHGDSADLYVSDDQIVLHLSRLDTPPTTADTEPPSLDTGQVTEPPSVDTGAPAGEPGTVAQPDTIPLVVTEPTPPPTAPPTNLRDALLQRGIDLDEAPAGVLGDATKGEVFCGSDAWGGSIDHPLLDAGECLVDHFERGEPAVAVSLRDFGDGHWVEVHRVNSADNVRRYVDFTNDVAGAAPPTEPWTIATCDQIEVDDLVECVGDVRDQRLADELVALGVDVDAAPDAVVEHLGEDFCGVVSLNSELEYEPAAPAACFVDHVEQGPAATVIVDSFTDEGDPVVTVYRFPGAPDAVMVFTDSTRDAFGSGDWSTSSCPSVELRGGTVSCTR